MVFDFKKFLLKFVNSLDPNFDETDIEKAYFKSKPTVGNAIVLLRSTDAAFKIENMFHNLPVKDMFPGNFPCVKFRIHVVGKGSWKKPRSWKVRSWKVSV